MAFGTFAFNYTLVGSSGYIAPRHIKAVKETGGNINSIVDVDFSPDSLKFFPDNIEKHTDLGEYFKKRNSDCDFIIICSPNFLHEEQISIALENQTNVICEKPVALNLDGLNNLSSIESESEAHVNNILQLRLHPVILDLKEEVKETQNNYVKLTYVAKREDSYFETWKGKSNLSGGLITNVGIHYLDLMTYIFGNFQDLEVTASEPKRSSGVLNLENCTIDWLFSFDERDVDEFIPKDQNSYRSIELNGTAIDFSDVPEDLHTTSYKKILKGKGFTLEDARSSLEIIEAINHN